MATHRNAALNQKLYRLSCPATAFEFDHVRARVHQRRSTANGLLFGFLVAAKRQIADQPSRALHPAQAACHTFGVINHDFECDPDGAGQPLADHAKRIAHQ